MVQTFLNKNEISLTLLKSHKADDLLELKLGNRGEAVELLQQLLFIKIDGIFGPQASRRVKAFKKIHNLYTSDVGKSYIWRLLMENEREWSLNRLMIKFFQRNQTTCI